MYAFVSVGQCGGGILDAIFSDNNLAGVSKALAINSATTDLINMKNISRKEWLGVSKSGFLWGGEKDFESIISGGYGQDRGKAESDAAGHYGELLESLSRHFLGGGIETKRVSCAFVLFSLGGGTGSGIGPIVAAAFRGLGIPVIAIVVMPAVEEGSLAASNAYVSLKRLVAYANTTILVDNQRIAYTGNMANAYGRYNDYVARSLVELVLGSASESINPAEFPGNPPVIDINDIITATSLRGRPAYACLARSSERARGLLHYLFPIAGWKRIDVIKLLYESFLKLTLEGAKPEKCEKNLALLRLPAHYLQSEGMLAPIDIIRSFLSENSGMKQTHLGVSLSRKNLVSSVLLFTYSEENVERIGQLRSQATYYKQERAGQLSLPRMFLTKIQLSGRGKDISGAEVVVGGVSKPDGSVFALEKGRHVVKVVSGSHEGHKATVSIDKNSVISIGLIPKDSKETNLAVSVEFRGEPVENAEIVIGDITRRSGAGGRAEFTLARGTRKLTVIHPDYRIAEKEVELTKPTQDIRIALKKAKGVRGSP